MSTSPSDFDLAALLEEETLIIRHGGEIPEIAFHGSLYYLCHDPEGPGLTLTEIDLEPLKQAVIARYCEIIHRDLEPDNRDKSIYRGLARCLANWQRLRTFLTRHQLMLPADLRADTARALASFLGREHRDVTSGRRKPCINCSAVELHGFVQLLGLDPAELPPGWRDLCCK
ncbi:MAG: hypothetical protein L3J03_10010 [Desulfobacterales bacterium]|nr:hypothetical protein [Desulfobacterales bacterium]